MRVRPGEPAFTEVAVHQVGGAPGPGRGTVTEAVVGDEDRLGQLGRHAPWYGVDGSYRKVNTMIGGTPRTSSGRCGFVAGTGGLMHRSAMSNADCRTSGATARDAARSASAWTKDVVPFRLSWC